MMSSYIILLSSPLENISEVMTEIKQSKNFIYDFILKYDHGIQQKYIINRNNEENFTPSVEIDSLRFRYNENEDYLFKDINLSIKAGNFVTFTGKSGSGKTTLAELINKTLSPVSGRILFGGYDIKIVTDEWLSEKIFMDTILFNMQIANPHAKHDQIIHALALSCFRDDFNLSENELLSMQIGDEGTRLSGGQKQRLSLARLFLRAPPPELIILDEITSALYWHNEKVLYTNIKNYFPDATIINISHRITTMENSDYIFVFERGCLIDGGTFF